MMTTITHGVALNGTVSEAIVRVPPNNTEDIRLLSSYLNLIYPVIRVEVCGPDSKVIRIRSGSESSSEELCNAQNFALRFLGPESLVVLMMPLTILQLCTLRTMRRYLAVSCRVIVTVKGNCALILRGPCEATRRLNSALENLQKATAPPNDHEQAKLRALQQLCTRLNIEFCQLSGIAEGLKSGLFDLLVDMESARMSEIRLQNNIPTNFSQNSISATASISNEPAFVEAFRKPKNAAEQAPYNTTGFETPSHQPINQKRLRPIIIDGANIAHGEVSKSGFSAQNVRVALNYFKSRGHDEIAIIMHGIRQAVCMSCFSKEELDRHFIFTSVRRLDNKPIMIADDDSVILEFASKKNAVVISNDQYRDWLNIRPEFRDVIENRVLPFSIRAGVFIISHFPMGKKKPSLDQILTFPD